MKYYGKIGYVESVMITKGRYEEQPIKEAYYMGDVVRRSVRNAAESDKILTDRKVTNDISILADPYAFHHFHQMRYIEYCGVFWEISQITVEYPRLRITLGEVYHGPTL